MPGAMPPQQALNKFGDPSYGSPQSAIMGKMGLELPRQMPPPMDPWPFMSQTKRKK